MKKILPYFFAITLVLIVFTGCNPLFPLDKDQFDLGDTVQVHIGEKMFESDNFWVRVDSIQDGRCPIGLHCWWAGEARVWLTVSYKDSLKQFYFSSYFDSLTSNELIYWGMGGPIRISLDLIDVNPYPELDIIPAEKDIWASFAIAQMSVDRKPNLYLYPEKKTKMNVSLQFPHGGGVIESDPLYPDAWQNIKVKADGRIDQKYDYLYYECAIPDLWQYSEGWIVKQEKLSEFFTSNLANYGFNDAEIEDFLEFWIPELNYSPYYEIYPQYSEMVNPIIRLKISPKPDSILRMHYVIKATDEYFDLPIPDIPVFERKGFTVVEWGVILK